MKRKSKSSLKRRRSLKRSKKRQSKRYHRTNRCNKTRKIKRRGGTPPRRGAKADLHTDGFLSPSGAHDISQLYLSAPRVQGARKGAVHLPAAEGPAYIIDVPKVNIAIRKAAEERNYNKKAAIADPISSNPDDNFGE